MKKVMLKNVSLLIALVAAVYLVGNYGGTIKNQLLQMLNVPGSSVKGASTKRAEELSEKFQSDFATQAAMLQQQLLHLDVSDVINGMSRLQKIPKDISTVQAFTKEQINHFTKKK